MDRLIMSIRVTNVSAWDAFFKLYVSDMISQERGEVISRFSSDEDCSTIFYLVNTTNPRLSQFLRSQQMLNLLRRFGQFQGFEVMRYCGDLVIKGRR